MANRSPAKLPLGLVGVLALNVVLPRRANHSTPSLPSTGAHSVPTTRPTVPATSAFGRADYLSVAGGRLYYEIAGAGHMVNLEHPSEFNDLVLGFLGEHRTSPRGRTSPPATRPPTHPSR